MLTKKRKGGQRRICALTYLVDNVRLLNMPNIRAAQKKATPQSEYVKLKEMVGFVGLGLLEVLRDIFPCNDLETGSERSRLVKRHASSHQSRRSSSINNRSLACGNTFGESLEKLRSIQRSGQTFQMGCELTHHRVSLRCKTGVSRYIADV